MKSSQISQISLVFGWKTIDWLKNIFLEMMQKSEESDKIARVEEAQFNMNVDYAMRGSYAM